MTPTLRLFAAAAGALTLTAGAVQAQPQGTGGPPSQGAQQQPDLSVILHLRPDQQGAYASFRAASQPSPDQVSQMHAARQNLTSLPTPARLDRIAAVLRLQMDMFQRNAQATRAFYSQLSPDQQHTFDQVTAPPTGRGRPQG